MSTASDVIVIGAGHNGLACAAALARAGLSVLVVEARATIGGLAGAFEFHPGYRAPGVLHDSTGVRPGIVDSLGLGHHGLRLRPTPPDILSLEADGPGLMVAGDPRQAAAAVAARSERDAAALVAWGDYLAKIRPTLSLLTDGPALDLVDAHAADLASLARHALRLRKLGKRDMMELIRVLPLSLVDGLGEWFETPVLQGALALPALLSSLHGPYAPWTHAELLLTETAAGPGVVGDGPALTLALEKAARAYGARIRTDARVSQILLDDAGRVEGVALASGEDLRTGVIAAACDPRTTLGGLVPVGALETRLEHNLDNYRCRGATAQLLLALDKPLQLAEGRDVARARVAPSLLALERAADAVKYGDMAEEPALDLYVPTVERPSLAPAGGAVVSILAHYVPHALRGGWTDEARARLGDRVLAQLERHAPGVRDSIVAQVIRTPVDLERDYGLTGGHLYHGEHAVDQRLVRPIPGCARYRTPIPGLYLCGSGSYPGGGLTCAPGYNAAGAILRK
ncbi:MAG: NAD(P)/FAD-dependent oxidoreductase [Myxococcales bacterium]|nr:NAD(P)/FAD-dependent oxidoreductase [Myxococcales bacterium]